MFLKRKSRRHAKPSLESTLSIRWVPHVLGLLILTLSGCGKPPAIAPPEPPVVTVEHPRTQTFDTVREFTGKLRSVEMQEVRAQVTGYLKAIKFTEGGFVNEGDALFEIDPEQYDAALANAKASVVKAEFDVQTAKAQAEQAKAEFDRAERSRGAITGDEFDKRKAAAISSVANLSSVGAFVDVAKSVLRKAEFDKANCTVKSAVKGKARVSRTLLTVGNLVQAGQTVLCKVTSTDPIHAYWDVDENTSLEYRRKVFDTKEIPNPRDVRKLKCWIGMKDEQLDPAGRWPHEGVVDYLDPEMNRATNSREIRGLLPNPGGRLTPGDSVRVQVEAGAPKPVITVPEIAVSSQQQQKFVYVVKKNAEGKSIAEFRPVVLGEVREIQGVRYQIIEKGVDVLDLLVVNGLLRVRPGAEVNAQEQPSLGTSAK
jgi:RND family efflux transporter MFP subunit